MQTAVTSNQPVQLFESERLLYDLTKTPADDKALVERYVRPVILQLALRKGNGIDTEDLVRRVLHVVQTVQRVASPGAYLVDTYPILCNFRLLSLPFK